MKTLKKILAGLAVMALAFALVACGGSPAPAPAEGSGSGSADAGSAAAGGSDKTYIIATDTVFAPFEYTDENNNYVGIDIDILEAVAKDQGFSYELQPLGFDAALQAVQSGQADGVIAGMSITEKRREVFDFSEPYYDSTVCAAAVAGGEVASLEDLNGKNVAVKSGTMSQAWAESIAEQYGFTMTVFDTSDVMYQDVAAGNSAACFEDTPVMSYAISTGNVNLDIIGTVDSSSEFATPYGFAVNKGDNAELLQMFNDGLANIKADGTYDKIVNSYVQA